MITNGKDTAIGYTGLPDVSSTLEGWFQKIVFGIVAKSLVNNRTVETITQIESQGVLQPLTAQQLEIKPEGQRGWNWFMLHCQPSLSLQLDDTVNISGTRFNGRYRVMARTGYDQYGYIQYDLVKDYQP